MRLRLQRFGRKNLPFYRVVAADARVSGVGSASSAFLLELRPDVCICVCVCVSFNIIFGVVV